MRTIPEKVNEKNNILKLSNNIVGNMTDMHLHVLFLSYYLVVILSFTDKKRKIEEKTFATNPVVAAAEQFSKIEENRRIFYGQITESLQKISAAAEQIAIAETRKAAALERIAEIKAAKYANLL